jgi:CHAD domain-containing protein
VPEPVVYREAERKFRVSAGYAVPDLDGVAARVEEHDPITLTTVYVDTPDLRLVREGLTLRRRTGTDDEGWHLKVPVRDGEPGLRDEIRLPLSAGTGEHPPTRLRDLVRAIVRTAPLQVAATLKTERTTRLLYGPDGGCLAELVDDEVTMIDGSVDRQEGVTRFREVELEARPGADGEALEAVAQALMSAGATEGAFESKVAQALGPLALGPPEVPEPAEVRPGDPARLAIAAHLARHTRALRREDVLMRLDTDDAVHQLRVAARRLRSGLRTFRPLLDPEWSQRLSDELRWLGTSLGELRDREVMLLRLEGDLDRLLPPGLDTEGAHRLVRRRLQRDMAGAREQALEALGSDRHLALHEELVTAAGTPQTRHEAERPCTDVLPPLVAKAWRRLERDARALSTDGPDAEWHATRIAAKKARYAAEACAPVFGKPAQKLGKQLARVTEALGEHQDAAVAAERLQDLALSGRVGAETAFCLGVLHAAEREAVRQARTDFVDLWPDVSRKRWRKWL